MSANVSLKAVVDEMETVSDQRHAYVNKRTGEVVSISDEEIEAVDSEEPLEDYPDWLESHDLPFTSDDNPNEVA